MGSGNCADSVGCCQGDGVPGEGLAPAGSETIARVWILARALLTPAEALMAIEEIYILHRTHVDIGYTDLQPVIYRQHLDIIDQALDLCAVTDSYPDDARFRWVNEFSWPVVRYLQERPGRAEELLSRHREARMELCGLYLDPTELYDKRTFEESLKPALRLAAEHDIGLSTVVTADIPGQGWGLVDLMGERGLPYLSASPNAMVSKPIEVERIFYWGRPGGQRVLVWMTDWRKGWYGEGYQLGFPEGFETVRERLPEYLDLLSSEGYPWSALQVSFSADNRPPCEGLSDTVAAWNETVGSPRMRIATNSEFFERMLELHGEAFPVYEAAWPDWWSNGLGSAAFESSLSRETHCRLQRIEAMQEALADETDLWSIFEDLLFFDEHTWGSRNTAAEPYAFRTRAAWVHKSSYIYRAADAAERLETQLAQTLGASSEGVTVFNPLEAGYAGPVMLPDLPGEVKGLCLQSPAGGQSEAVSVQHSVATPLARVGEWAILEVPAGETQAWAAAEPEYGGAEAGPTCSDGVLENEFLRIAYDTDLGRVTSICDLQTGAEWLDTSAPWGFAETIHERITSSRDRDAIWDTRQTEVVFGKSRMDAPFERRGALGHGAVLHVEEGPLFASLTWESWLPDVRYMETEIRLWRRLRRIDVEVRMDKRPQEKYESLYVALPFWLRRPRAYVHSCGTVFEAGVQQLPGSCRDFFAVENFAALEDEDRWVAVCPLDAPLVQFAQIQTGRWLDDLDVHCGAFYPWMTNNFWYTNFPAYQQGRLRFRYAITLGDGPFCPDAAAKSGEAARVGLVTSAHRGG